MKKTQTKKWLAFLSKNWLWILLIIVLPICAFVANGIVTCWKFDEFLIETILGVLAYIGTIILGWVAFNQNKRIIKVEEDNFKYQNRPTVLLAEIKQHGFGHTIPSIKTQVVYIGKTKDNTGKSSFELRFVNSSPFPVLMSILGIYESQSDSNFEVPSNTNFGTQISMMSDAECAYCIYSDNKHFFVVESGTDERIVQLHIEVINRFGEVYSELISVKIKALKKGVAEYTTYNYQFEKMTINDKDEINFKSA